MNAFLLKIALIVKTILAALGMGGCLTNAEVDTLDDIIDEVTTVEQQIEDLVKK